MDYESAIRSVINLFMTYGQTHQPFADMGPMLLKYLTIIAIAFNGIKLLLDYAAPNEMIGKLVNIIMIWGLASFVLTSNAPQMFDNGFTELANMASKAAGNNAAPETAVLQTMGKFTSVAMALFKGKDNQSANSSANQSDQDILSDPKAWLFAKLANLSIGNLVMGFVNVFYKLFVALFIILTGLLYVGQYLISQVMVQIGFMVMPIMVPWLLLDATSFIFDGWYKFMINAGLTKVIGAIIFGMSTDLLTAVVDLANKAGNDEVANFGLYSSIMILSALLAYLMLQTSSIAHGLMAGNASSGKFLAPSKLTPGGSTTSVSKGIQGTAKNIGGGIKDGLKSGMNGGGFKGGIKTGMKSMMGMKSPGGPSNPTPSAAPPATAATSAARSPISTKLQAAKAKSGR
jgi:type IV secretory pathway VirB6-like protein